MQLVPLHLGAARNTFQKLGDEEGAHRTRGETMVVEGIVAANNPAVGTAEKRTKGLTEAMRRLGRERDGWGVALLVQATPPAARALLGHEGWQGAITAVAETAEALLRAVGKYVETVLPIK
jgi:hypothetical protein